MLKHPSFDRPDILWPNIIGDGLIALAFFFIPFLLLYFRRQRSDLRYGWMFTLFSFFIWLCAAVNILSIITIWKPVYQLLGIVKIVTGLFSLGTALLFLYILPRALKVPSIFQWEEANAQLKKEAEEMQRVQDELRKKNRLLADTQQIMHIGSWEWDVVNDTITWSDEMYRIYGLEKESESFSAAKTRKYIHPEDAEHVRDVLNNAMREQSKYELYYRIILNDGSTKIIHGRGEILRESNRPVRLMGTTQDVTAILQKEKDLHLKTRDLERSNEHLKRFAYATSHDLREPVRGMVGYAQMLKAKYEHEFNQEANERLTFIAEEGKRMIHMIESVLDFARVEAAERVFTEVDMNVLLAQVIAVLKIELENKNATVEVADLPTVKGDASQLKILFQNLVHNAISYNISNAPTVNISVVSDGNAWKFIIEDNGIGFDMKYKEKIFEMFQRLHSRTIYKGSGIGLAVCKNIAQMHSGHIWATSEPGKGSTFYLTLPK